MYLVENTIIDRWNKLPISHVNITEVSPDANIKPFEELKDRDIHRDLFKTKKEAELWARELENE